MNRAIRIINETIKDLEVSIKGKIVLTEVGSNNYIFMPIIASLCGALKVYALAKDSKYGLSKDIISQCEIYCDQIGVDNIVFIENELDLNLLRDADIITNSGNLRPLDKEKLQYLKPSAVIPLMFEAWEIRGEDLDIGFCKKNNLQVAGTWENHPLLKVFDYCGLLAMKMALNAGFEIMGNNILVWSDDHFGDLISNKFLGEGARVLLSNDQNLFYEQLAKIDFVFIADYDEQKEYFVDGGIFDAEKITTINPGIVFIHLYGKICIENCKMKKINIFPAIDGFPSTMTYTLGNVGLIPIIKLQVAGFKVAQEMIENKITKLSQII